jgi:hypothetical protein
MFNPAICDMCGDSWHPVQSCPFVNEDAVDVSASIEQSTPQHRTDAQEEVDTCVDKESPDKKAGASKEERPKVPNVSSYDELIFNRIPGNRPASKVPEEKPTHPNISSHDELFPVRIPGDRPKGKAQEEKPAHPNLSSHDELFPDRIPGDRPQSKQSKQPEEKPTHPNFSSYDELFPSLRRGDTKPEPNQEKPTHPNFSSYDDLFPSRLHRGDTKPEPKPGTPIQPTTNSNRAGAKSKEEPYDGYLTGENANGFGDMREEEMEEAKRACQ